MPAPKYNTALIVGAGAGLSASLARLFAREGIKVALAARKIEKLGELCNSTGAKAFACDATNAGCPGPEVYARVLRLVPAASEPEAMRMREAFITKGFPATALRVGP